MKIGSSPGPSFDVQYAARVQKLALAPPKYRGGPPAGRLGGAGPPAAAEPGKGPRVNTVA